MVLGHAGASDADAIVRAVEEALAAWLAYRDGVARAMGIARTLDLALRPATEADAPAILPMMIAFNRGESIAWDPAAGEAPLRRLLATPELGRVTLISVAGALAGYAVVTFGFDLEFGGRDALLTELYLKPEARGQGVGRRALERILEAARAEGAGAIHLQVRADNPVAQRVYRAAGFVGTTRLFLSRILGAPG